MIKIKKAQRQYQQVLQIQVKIIKNKDEHNMKKLTETKKKSVEFLR